MISVYKGVWQDKFYLVASEVPSAELHQKLGIPYHRGLRTKGVSDRDAKIAVSNLEKVLIKPVSGASQWCVYDS